jgi:ubiquinone biosynthesis protein COQ4
MTSTGFDIPRALRAARALSEDPDDTRHVFTLIESLSWKSNERILKGYQNDAEGRRMLRERPALLPILCDRAALAAMPQGSLARAYLSFVDSEGITADGLVAASLEGQKGLHEPGSDAWYVGQRMRDTHDLWHTVTGYKGDLIGEVALLSFSNAQIWNPGVTVVVGVGVLKIRRLRVARAIASARLRGMRARWLPVAPWERLLPLPLTEVRARLRVKPVRPYEELRTSTLRDQGELAPRAM